MFRWTVWKGRAACAAEASALDQRSELLLDLAFLEFDMLAQHRIVFLDREFLGHGAGVLLGDIEKAAATFAVEADFRGGRLRHGMLQENSGLIYALSLRCLRTVAGVMAYGPRPCQALHAKMAEIRGFLPGSSRLAAKTQTCQIDVPGLSRNQIGEHPARSGRHGPAQGAVSGIEIEIRDRGFSDDRRAVWGHRTQTRPEFSLRKVAGIGKQVPDDVIECVAPRLAQL